MQDWTAITTVAATQYGLVSAAPRWMVSERSMCLRPQSQLSPCRGVLAARLPGYRVGGSDWEQERDRLWDQLGLPSGVRQHRVTVESGETYILDRALPDLMIGVEWDSYAFHTVRSALDHDSERRANLVAAGWTMIGFTSNSTPAHIARTVWSTVARLRPAETGASGATTP